MGREGEEKAKRRRGNGDARRCSPEFPLTMGEGGGQQRRGRRV